MRVEPRSPGFKRGVKQVSNKEVFVEPLKCPQGGKNPGGLKSRNVVRLQTR